MDRQQVTKSNNQSRSEWQTQRSWRAKSKERDHMGNKRRIGSDIGRLTRTSLTNDMGHTVPSVDKHQRQNRSSSDMAFQLPRKGTIRASKQEAGHISYRCRAGQSLRAELEPPSWARAWNYYLGAVGCIKVGDNSVSLALHAQGTNMDLLLSSSWRAVRRA